ncbi:zn-dependent hydrolase, glyoxylase [Salinarchaeum sp. Harcht-Bsk1]|uniref:MBL fold metallo-hydrolase n=1 Tax=Salinarchaeum sp. Harcht-Bsk1 TaxID=1333523 RepID=UPI0003423579|nr:MBL fold metallo-hydrolase [Salinarchaeum sp. Harcht-Bsk1]AGN01234.1 zn-dependent hydrolase, glyoxylase [Salinarchaeum sp. Harcht-Bsk1]
MVEPVAVSPETYVVDTHEMGIPERTAAYVVDDEQPTIVDTGLSTGAPHILDALDEIGLDPADVEYVALTHIHMDHAGGAAEIVEACANATVLCHEYGVDFISDPEVVPKLVEGVHEAVGDLANDYGTMRPIPRDRIRVLEGGETIDLGARSLEVVHAPGHAPHQVAYYDGDNGCLFPGDECGEYVDDTVVPSTPPPDFDPDAIEESLDGFADSELDAIYFPHYGEHTAPQQAIAEYRTVLDEWVEAVAELHERHDDTAAIVDALLEDHLYADLYEERVAWELVRLNVDGVLTYLDE